MDIELEFQLKTNIYLMLYAALISMFVLIGSMSRFNRGQKFMRYYKWLLSSHIVMMLGEVGIWAMLGVPEYALFMKLCCALSVGAGSLLNVMLVYCTLGILEERMKISYRPAHWMAAGSCVIIILALLSVFNGILFDVDGTGFYMDGPYYVIVWISDWVMMFLGIGIVVWNREALGFRVMLSMLSFYLLPCAAVIFPSIWYPIPQYLAVTLSLIIMYIVFFEELAKKFARNEKELAESRIAITLSQVQPHFLYNTLATISELCERDPVLASGMTNRFARYLRRNMDTLRCTSPVPFAEELDHVKTYLQLERLRFGADLQMEFDIREKEFKLPPLTLQPLAENAIKHGMMGREGEFHITIRSVRKGNCHEIQVIDDGVGFDPKEEKQDGRSHVGLANVRKILLLMVDGKLLVDSCPGQGTCVTIQIPVKKEEKNL